MVGGSEVSVCVSGSFEVRPSLEMVVNIAVRQKNKSTAIAIVMVNQKAFVVLVAVVLLLLFLQLPDFFLNFLCIIVVFQRSPCFHLFEFSSCCCCYMYFCCLLNVSPRIIQV